MRRTYSKEQKAYIEAKKALDILESQEAKMEAEFVASLGITNDDGTTPEKTWMIDNDEIAEKAIDDFGKIEEESGLWEKILSAKESLKTAEENLIQYALSIIPFQKERATLTKAARENYKIRMQILESVLKLDARTVKR